MSEDSKTKGFWLFTQSGPDKYFLWLFIVLSQVGYWVVSFGKSYLPLAYMLVSLLSLLVWLRFKWSAGRKGRSDEF